MAGEMEKAKTGITNTFNSLVKHMFSPTMIFMMAAMAFPAIGVAASAAGTTATLGDIGLATVDMYWEMIQAPFTDGSTVIDAFGNAFDGNFAPQSYEMGMMDHGNMAHDMAAHAGMDHGMGAVLDKMSPDEITQAMEMSKGLGVSLSEYLMSM